MSHDVNMLRAKLRAAMDKVGRTNGHACPQSASNVDAHMHELFVAAESLAYWKTRFDEAKEAALDAAITPTELDDIVTRVTKNMQGETAILADGELYQLQMSLSKPSERFDKTKMHNYMRVELALSSDVINRAFASATTLASPAKTVKVIGK
jgi:hypothetical protein